MWRPFEGKNQYKYLAYNRELFYCPWYAGRIKLCLFDDFLRKWEPFQMQNQWHRVREQCGVWAIADREQNVTFTDSQLHWPSYWNRTTIRRHTHTTRMCEYLIFSYSHLRAYRRETINHNEINRELSPEVGRNSIIREFASFGTLVLTQFCTAH